MESSVMTANTATGGQTSQLHNQLPLKSHTDVTGVKRICSAVFQPFWFFFFHSCILFLHIWRDSCSDAVSMKLSCDTFVYINVPVFFYCTNWYCACLYFVSQINAVCVCAKTSFFFPGNNPWHVHQGFSCPHGDTSDVVLLCKSQQWHYFKKNFLYSLLVTIYNFTVMSKVYLRICKQNVVKPLFCPTVGHLLSGW